MSLPEGFQTYCDNTEKLFSDREVLTFRQEIKRFNSYIERYEQLLQYFEDFDDARIEENYAKTFSSSDADSVPHPSF